MSAKLVPTVKTVCSPQEMIKGFIEGWIEQFKTLPSKESIGVLWAQNQLETGGTVYMWNYNIGNVKYVPSKNPNDDINKEYCMLHNVWEMENGKKVIYQPPHPATWFRSFPSLKDGISHHMNFLMNKRYKIAWQAVVEGDPVKFCKLLKQQGYYTASEELYTKAVMGYFNRFLKDKTYDNIIKQYKFPQPNLQEPIKPIHNIEFQRDINFEDQPLKLTFWQQIQNQFYKLFK